MEGAVLEVVDRIAEEPLGPVLNVDDTADLEQDDATDTDEAGPNLTAGGDVEDGLETEAGDEAGVSGDIGEAGLHQLLPLSQEALDHTALQGVHGLAGGQQEQQQGGQHDH